MLDSFQGLPVHILIVHATVVTVPAACIAVALASVYPRFRNWFGIGTPVLAVLALILVPITTSSGDKLKDHLVGRHSTGEYVKLIQQHEDLADTLLWYVIPLAIVGLAVYLLHRNREVAKSVTVVLAVIAVGLGAATLVDVARIGHAGSKAAYNVDVNLHPN